MPLPTAILEHIADLHLLVAPPIEAGTVPGRHQPRPVAHHFDHRQIHEGAAPKTWRSGCAASRSTCQRAIFRCVPSFAVSTPALQCLAENIFVGTGARFPDNLTIFLFRLA